MRSAPCDAHFADRDDLLAAVAVRAFELFWGALLPEMDKFADPADRLAGMARGYVRFAAGNRPLFEVLYEAAARTRPATGTEAAEQPLLNDAFLDAVRALAVDARAEDLATAVEATAARRDAAALDDGPDQESGVVELAAERTARAVLALIEGRPLLG